MTIKKRIYKLFKVYPDSEVEKIVAFWTVQHKTALQEIERLREEARKHIAVDKTRVLSVKNGKLKLGEYELTEPQTKTLKEEAVFMKRTELWNIFQNTLKEEARSTMFEKSQNFEDMRTGKAMLYNLREQEKILEEILKL